MAAAKGKHLVAPEDEPLTVRQLAGKGEKTLDRSPRLYFKVKPTLAGVAFRPYGSKQWFEESGLFIFGSATRELDKELRSEQGLPEQYRLFGDVPDSESAHADIRRLVLNASAPYIRNHYRPDLADHKCLLLMSSKGELWHMGYITPANIAEDHFTSLATSAADKAKRAAGVVDAMQQNMAAQVLKIYDTLRNLPTELIDAEAERIALANIATAKQAVADMERRSTPPKIGQQDKNEPAASQ